ncbi:MAG: hypothetical protein P1U89_22885 [Verrucomicrobiales bacterium]|nr:hypothetical protein [Verrucomicrobiales bacterium]
MALKFQRKTTIESNRFSINIGLLFLRFATVCTLVYYELAIHLQKAWNNVWKEEEWGLIDQFVNLSLPLPGAVAVAIILTAFITSLGVLLGFLGRINAIILIVIMGALLIARVQTSNNFTPEVVVQYITILITLAVTGSGKFSMDHLLTAQRIRRKA